MIKQLRLENIGPAPLLEVGEFGQRLNLFTGDNGLGKTFLLDACWYALTRTWPDGKQFYPLPEAPKKPTPTIDYAIIGQNGREAKNTAEYQYRGQSWMRKQARQSSPGLVIYARIDGGFSVWDPARNYRHDDENEDAYRARRMMDIRNYRPDDENENGRERPPAYQFTKDQVWDGLEEGEGKEKVIICNGLLRDVESWRARSNGSFALLGGVLEGLSERENAPLIFGEGVRVRLDDVRDIPTLQMPYGSVPVTQAAAGMRRVLALAYLLVWAWEEHVRAAGLQKDSPTNRIVVLFDEVEAHLHPKWQRVFLPSLIKVVDGLLVTGRVEAIKNDPAKILDQKARAVGKEIPRSVQIIATTHAPMVLASVETLWRGDKDKLFILDIKRDDPGTKAGVTLAETPWARQGDVVGWLVSNAFGMRQARSKEAEDAIEAAEKWMRGEFGSLPAALDSKETIHAELLRVLAGHDPFWPRWIVKAEDRA
jgi:hypothetical protein